MSLIKIKSSSQKNAKYGEIVTDLSSLVETQKDLAKFLDKLNSSSQFRGKIDLRKYTGSFSDPFVVTDGDKHWTVSAKVPTFDIPNSGYISQLQDHVGEVFIIATGKFSNYYSAFKKEDIIEFTFYIDKN